MAIIVRRIGLGNSSVKGICANSTKEIKWAFGNSPDLPKDDTYIRWGCTSTVPTNSTINTSKSIHRVNDKRGFRLLLTKYGLCPRTYESFQHFSSNPTFPVIVRRKVHSQGQYLDKVDNIDDLHSICERYGEDNYYISKFIEKVKEYRVFVCQGRVVWMVKKIPANENSIAWNVSQGGKFINVRWSHWPVRVAERAIPSRTM